ncbi:polysaccharide deacetylase family protein [Bacillus thuringiensis]|uniref:polysaccharide deacetylase family protein n=1 Tax=Bacillus thuringiensis TaxID=1428 RepID=UPI0011551194|nr:polysaccharide deacetylase family protein [Bacillus thuringiensis]
MDHGILIVSLDFELYWGVQDTMSLGQYKENLLGVRQAIPKMLELFQAFDIHATWATVGKLFFETKSQLLSNIPLLKPSYENPSFSGYHLISQMGDSEEEDPYYYAPSLIKKIALAPHQEIGTHTFSHYYCLEAGQTDQEFEADICKAVEIGNANGINIQSIAFPRNQINPHYLAVCKKLGIQAYRGNEDSFIYRASSFHENQAIYKRILRLVDAYVNVTGHHIYSLNTLNAHPIINLPASRFLRPYKSNVKIFENLRLKRITNSLTKAAKENKMYHLWWHPHNFGVNLENNIQFLSKILSHYSHLKKQYGMKSYNMKEVAFIIRNSVEKKNLHDMK